MRVRLRYTTELGKVRFLSHRDLARAWERAIRRAELPIAYSEGFSPRPKVHFGLALSVGHESMAEYIDIDLTADVEVDDLPERLTACLPNGVDVVGAVRIADNEPALQAVVDSVTWSFTVEGDRPTMEAGVAEILSRVEIPLSVERKGKAQHVDLRPMILDAEVVDLDEPGRVTLRVELATTGRSVRPVELLAAFEPPLRATRVLRLDQWMNDDGIRRAPLPAGPLRSPVATTTG